MKKLLSRWFDLSTTEGKLKLFIAASGIALVVILGMAGTLAATNQPAFCSVCHKTMSPEYTTWSVTSHANINCTACHIKPGLINTLEHKIMTMKEPVLYLTGTWEKPIKPTEIVENENCQRCHSKNRNFTVEGDLIIPHERHEEAGILCVACHAGVAHAKIYERGLTGEKAPVQPEDWTVKYAKTVATPEFTNPDMDTCIQCHHKRKVPISCETCHKSIYTPTNHKNKTTWRTGHGLEAEKNVKSCQSCHNYGFTDSKIKLDNPAAAYAWSNNFCSSCHSKMPPGHNNTTWRNEHGQAEKVKGIKNCEACHRPNDKYPDKAPTKVACNQCHYTPN